MAFRNNTPADQSLASQYDSHGFELKEEYISTFSSCFDHDKTGYNPGADLISSQMPGIHLDNSDRNIPVDLPEHACRYCTQSNPECVAQCNICKHWFCNGSTGNSSARHMVKSRHKEIMLHKDSPIDATLLECYNCGSKNVFILGFVPAKSDSVVLLLCRNPCAYQHTSLSDLSQWEPVISEKHLISWLVKIPKEDDLLNIRQVNGSQIATIEEFLRVDTKGHFVDDSETNELEDPPEYRDVYEPLIELEANYDKRLKESQAQHSITLRCEVGINKKKNVYFTIPQSDSEMRIVQGDEMKMRNALKSFVANDSNMSEYIRKTLLGSPAEEEHIKLILPK
ncbi:hypothetical protein MXB_1393, partial [Myxobolus squamalis]